MEFDSNLLKEFDWRGFWKSMQQGRTAISDDPAGWDVRAASFAKRKVSSYSKTFVDFLALEEGETAFDMGCGTGEIAIQLAKGGSNIIAADFSPQMLSYLKENALEAGVGTERGDGIGFVRPIQMSWSDDWDAHGIGENCVDVAYASRSTIVSDLGMALDKLCHIARKRCAVTISAGNSPSEDGALLEALGRDPVCNYDMVCAYNILVQKGYAPEIRMIASDKRASYESLESAIEHAISHVKDASESDKAFIAKFVESHLVENDDPEDPRPLKLDYQRYSNWAFISWNL